MVGREGELSRLVGALGRDARLVLVVGDAGVGKTRLVAEGMARAAAAGMVVARGECLPLADKLSLLPVAEALGELATLDSGSLLATALNIAPPYVRGEVGRLVPQLGSGELATGPRGEGWRRDRLFTAVAELLGAAARRSGLGVVIEDVHWADRETLDLLTFLVRAGRDSGVRVVVTCRSDEAPLDAHVIEWLAHVRGGGGVEEIRLGPLSREETAEQIASVAGGPAPAQLVDDLYARAEGNPFFTEQLVAAALLSPGGFSGLPAGLAESLAVRAGRCGDDARTALAALAVAGRPLTEDLLGTVTGLNLEAVRAGLRELAAARLLADTPADGHRPRHALLAEAVAAGMLPGERAGLHARTAQALAAAGDQALAAEIAGHWAAAGRPAEELPARVAAAEAAEGVFGYAEAAGHWRRAIELCDAPPGTAAAAGIDVPRLYVRAIDALDLSGDGVSAGLVAEEAYRRFADHPDQPTAAVICHRAAAYRQIEAPAAALLLIEAALRLFEQAPPSADYAEALFDYARVFLPYAQKDHHASLTGLTRALDIAEAAGATPLIPRILSRLAHNAFVHGQIEEGLAILQRGWAIAEASADGVAQNWLAVVESDALLRLAKFQSAAEVALRYLEAARHAGLEAWFPAHTLAANASEALLAVGRTDEAAVLIDPLTTGPPDPDHWVVNNVRAEIDLLRGDLNAAADRSHLLEAIHARLRLGEDALEYGRRAAELALWAGRPGDALTEVRRALPRLKIFDLTAICGRLLTAGLWACADLAERARARRDQPAAETAAVAASDLASWVDHMGGAPFTDHPFVATIPAERATWDAEQTRLAGASDPAAWSAAAKTWQGLDCPHRAGYAWWRHAEALLAGGHPPAAATAAVQAAAAAAGGHAPLLTEIRKLAARARIPLQAPTAASPVPGPAEPPAPYGLTSRELAVLCLLAAGRTNAQIGAELYMSPRTAGVHVSNILRKLGVTGRVQAAALAERAGLLDSQQP